MKKNLLNVLIMFAMLCLPAYSATVAGGVSKVGAGNSSRVVDAKTQEPLPNVQITIPKQGYRTFTDKDGRFELGTHIDGAQIMSVEKDGYRPFSLTVNDQIAAKPIVLGIEKSNGNDIVIETSFLHLGDDNYSPDSANAGDFRGKSVGPFFTKTFQIGQGSVTKQNYLVIGSITGIDTAMARSLGQNRIRTSFASAPEIYFNGSRIAEIQLNGDNQKIKIPNNLIRPNQPNEVTVKTGRNLMQTAYIDYDDIELMNLSIQSN